MVVQPPRSIFRRDKTTLAGLVSPSAFCQRNSPPVVNASPIGKRTPPSSTGPTAVPSADVRVAEDGAVGEVDELAGFGVAPVEKPNAAADVWLNRCAAAERKEAHSGGDRQDTQLQVLLDLGAVDRATKSR